MCAISFVKITGQGGIGYFKVKYQLVYNNESEVTVNMHVIS